MTLTMNLSRGGLADAPAPAPAVGQLQTKRAAIEFAVANHAPRPGDGTPSLIVLHTTQAHLAERPVDLDELAVLYDDPQVGQSVHVANDVAGVDARYVADDQAAYEDAAPQATSLHLAQLGVEDQSAWTRAQLASTASWLAYWSERWGIPLVHGTEAGVCQHSDLDPTARDCGQRYPLEFVLALAREQLVAPGEQPGPSDRSAGSCNDVQPSAMPAPPAGGARQPARVDAHTQFSQETAVNNQTAQSGTNKLVPLQTSPLTKFIRTGEGVLIFAFNLAMLIVPVVSSALTPEQAAKWAGIIDGVAVVARTGLKMVSLTQNATGIAPESVGANVTVDAQQLAAELVKQLPGDVRGPVPAEQVIEQLMADAPIIDQLVSDAEEMASTPPSAPATPAAGAGGGQDTPVAVAAGQ